MVMLVVRKAAQAMGEEVAMLVGVVNKGTEGEVGVGVVEVVVGEAKAEVKVVADVVDGKVYDITRSAAPAGVVSMTFAR